MLKVSNVTTWPDYSADAWWGGMSLSAMPGIVNLKRDNSTLVWISSQNLCGDEAAIVSHPLRLSNSIPLWYAQLVSCSHGINCAPF
mmetsp:Transcript_369/g.1397  ORF Transcript_369/g.1397 Transcript_369/m.1397 type:complete len:86 (+) Transcript_369:433-690(+)